MAEHDLEAVAFPTLDEPQLEAVGRCIEATLNDIATVTWLFRAGDRDVGIFIARSGEIAIEDESGETPKTIAVHRRGEFTGEVTSGQH